jgi:hypothetical protein
VPNAQVSEYRLARPFVFTPAGARCCDVLGLNTLPGTLVGTRKTTPPGSSSVPPGAANHAAETHYRLVLASLGLPPGPQVRTSPTSPTTIMLVAAHPGSPPSARHTLFFNTFPPVPVPPTSYPRRISLSTG